VAHPGRHTLQVEHITLMLDYEGKRLSHISAYGYEDWGSSEQVFFVDTWDSGSASTDYDLARWLIKMLKLAHTGLLA
jgi:hypothetical protein